eukprot:1159098-Pelagomonas_calceolata.AAC.9
MLHRGTYSEAINFRRESARPSEPAVTKGAGKELSTPAHPTASISSSKLICHLHWLKRLHPSSVACPSTKV